MSLPFTVEQFFAVFAAYNTAIWPVQVLAYALGLAAVGALWSSSLTGKRVILSTLGLFWGWNGIVYQSVFFAPINPAAKGFAAVFVLQAILFAASAIARNNLRFRVRMDIRSVLGLGLIFYALLIYELLGYAAGHGLMKGPLFGVAPCPTTIFTIGMLLMTEGGLAVWLAVIPVLWALIGSSAAVLLGVPEDFSLAVAAIVLLVFLGKAAFRVRSAGAIPPGTSN